MSGHHQRRAAAFKDTGLSFVSAVSGAGTSITLGAHEAGDLIIVFAFRDGSNTSPSLPTGFTNDYNAGGNSSSFRVGWKIAASSSEGSGTWTNASGLVAAVYRGAHATAPILSRSRTSFGSTGSGSVYYTPGFSFTETDEAGWGLAMVGLRSTGQGEDIPPSAMVNRTAHDGGFGCLGWHDTDGPVADFPGEIVVGGRTGTTTYHTVGLELRPAA